MTHVALAMAVFVPACSSGSDAAVTRDAPSTTPVSPTTGGDVVVVRYRLDRRTTDAATADFEFLVDQTLGDPRGWVRAGFRLERADDAPYAIVLAERTDVDALCRPYDTFGEFSCQNGPVVALNAERWRGAHPKWTGDLLTYRQMLVNHEVGHLLGMHHPDVQCPSRGEPAAVMSQQSTELDGCLPNPWPLDAEIQRAARHDLKLAPEYGE